MTINLSMPEEVTELKPRITVFGVGGAGGNAVNNMIHSGLEGVEFVVANTDAQAISQSAAERRIQMGTAITEGLGAGSHPDIGAKAAEEAMPEIADHLTGAHMVFITGGMGGGTGTGAAPVIARAAREQGILTVGVVTKPFQFEGARRMRIAEEGIKELQDNVDTLIVIPNQNLFRVANEKTTFADAFAMADQVLYSGVASVTDLMVREGLINLDFADVRSIMGGMGKAMMGTGEAEGEKRAIEAAEAAISNPLLDDVSMKGAQGVLISISGGRNDMTLFEVDEAATRIRSEVDADANIILGATFEDDLDGVIRVSVVATGIGDEIDRLIADDPRIVSFAKKSAPEEIVEEEDVIEAAEEAEEQEPMRVNSDLSEVEHTLFDGVYETSETQVRVRKIAPGMQMPQAPQAAEPVNEADIDPAQPFIPPAAEPVGQGAPRMPSVDDFPLIAQQEIVAKTAKKTETGQEEGKKRGGFFDRLTNVGLGLKERSLRPAAEDKPQDEKAPVRTEPEFSGKPISPEQASVEMPRRLGETLERMAAREPDEERLEIPAFLRRQAN
jgi:cell division protein FtsZ